MQSIINEHVENVKTNNSSASLIFLVNQYEKMFYKLFNKTFSYCSDQRRQDFSGDIAVIVYEACLRFDVSKKSRFGTFLFNGIRFHIYNLRKKYFSSKHEEALSLSQETHMSVVESLMSACERSDNSLDKIEEVKNALRLLPKSYRNVMTLLYFPKDGCKPTFQELGDVFGISKQRIEQIHSKSIQFLKKTVKKRLTLV